MILARVGVDETQLPIQEKLRSSELRSMYGEATSLGPVLLPRAQAHIPYKNYVKDFRSKLL